MSGMYYGLLHYTLGIPNKYQNSLANL